jgi:hypothetical protein
MTKNRGTVHRIPTSRRLVLDICWLSRFVPSFPVSKTLDLKEIHEIRERLKHAPLPQRISWTAIFVRAFSLVGKERNVFRRMFASIPYVRLYEHPHTVASITIHRLDHHGQERMIWARIRAAEEESLLSIQQQIDRATQGPIDEVFRDGARIEKLPQWLRRCSLWLGMHCQPRTRARKTGTFSISSLAGYGVSNAAHPLVVTSSLAFTPCDAQGKSEVTLICDHRVLDGVEAARGLLALEHVLNTTILSELQSLL